LRERHPDTTALDALLDLSRINVEPVVTDVADDNDSEEKIEWAIRPRPGWLAPIPVGYGAISTLYQPGDVKNARDKTVPFRFVESLYGLGQWLSPHRIDDLSQLLWYHHAEPQAGLYRCINHYSDITTVI
jgi:CRISPR-associated protein Csy2